MVVLKSGSEFREFSHLTVTFPEGSDHTSSTRPIIDVERREVTGALTPDPDVDQTVQKFLKEVRGSFYQQFLATVLSPWR